MLVCALDHAVSMCSFTAELWLDGRRMNAILMETFTDLSSKTHISLRPFALEFERDLHVQRGNELGVGELPDMEMVAGDDVGEVGDILLDVING